MYFSSYQTEKIESIEQRSIDTENPFNLLTPRHTFIILTTESGNKIKCEYLHTGQVEITYNYHDLMPGITSYHLFPKKPLSVHRAVTKFNHIAYSHKFDESIFNCQQVCKMFLKKTTRDQKLMLRNDELSVIQRRAWYTNHPRIFMQDQEHFRIRSEFPKNSNNIRAFGYFDPINIDPKKDGLNSGLLSFKRLNTLVINSDFASVLPSFYAILKDSDYWREDKLGKFWNI